MSACQCKLSVVQKLFSLHGFLQEASSEEPEALFSCGEKVEQLMCAKRAALGDVDTSALSQEGVAEVEAWIAKTTKPVLDDLVQRTEAACASWVTYCNERLAKKKEVMQPLALGLDKGKSWKAGLADDAPLIAVYEYSKPLIKGPASARVAAAFKDLKKDSCSSVLGNRNLTNLPPPTPPPVSQRPHSRDLWDKTLLCPRPHCLCKLPKLPIADHSVLSPF